MAASAAVDGATIRRVILASSLGTLFEWYDFYLYGSLAVFFGACSFPPGNETAQLLASLATFGAGFGVRPLGALVFGHVGDLDRPQVHVPRDDGDDGPVHGARRVPADLREDRPRGDGAPRVAAPPARARARRRVRRGGDVRGRARARFAVAATSPSTFRRRQRSGSSSAWASSARRGSPSARRPSRQWGLALCPFLAVLPAPGGVASTSA